MSDSRQDEIDSLRRQLDRWRTPAPASGAPLTEPQSAADVLAYLNEAVGELNPTMEQAEEIWGLMQVGGDEPLSRVCLAVQAWDRGNSYAALRARLAEVEGRAYDLHLAHVDATNRAIDAESRAAALVALCERVVDDMRDSGFESDADLIAARLAEVEAERDVWRSKATHYDDAAGRDRARLIARAAAAESRADALDALCEEALGYVRGCATRESDIDAAIALRARLATLTAQPTPVGASDQ